MNHALKPAMGVYLHRGRNEAARWACSSYRARVAPTLSQRQLYPGFALRMQRIVHIVDRTRAGPLCEVDWLMASTLCTPGGSLKRQLNLARHVKHRRGETCSCVRPEGCDKHNMQVVLGVSD